MTPSFMSVQTCQFSLQGEQGEEAASASENHLHMVQCMAAADAAFKAKAVELGHDELKAIPLHLPIFTATLID